SIYDSATAEIYTLSLHDALPICYFLESIGPELRQYIVAGNREELPFNRVERGWVYASAKNQNNYEGFGTDQDIYKVNYIFINNADRKSTRLNSSHVKISYAVFCL